MRAGRKLKNVMVKRSFFPSGTTSKSWNFFGHIFAGLLHVRTYVRNTGLRRNELFYFSELRECMVINLHSSTIGFLIETKL